MTRRILLKALLLLGDKYYGSGRSKRALGSGLKQYHKNDFWEMAQPAGYAISPLYLRLKPKRLTVP